MSPTPPRSAGEDDRLAVGRERWRLGLVDRAQRNPRFNLPGQHVLDDQRAFLAGADEVGEPIADRRPRHPRHRHAVDAHHHEIGEAEILVEAFGEVADDRAVLGRDQHDVDFAILAVDGDDRDQIAGRRRRDRERFGVLGLLGVGSEVAAVVGRPLLVAERLEAVLDVAIEGLVELFRFHPEGFFVGVFAAADDALAQREQELADPFLAESRLDELEDRVAQVVDQPGGALRAVAFELGHLRHDVGDRGVAHLHQVERRPGAALIVREPFVDPQRHAAPDQRLRNDVELEDVRELVRDEAVEPIRRIVDRQQHAVAVGLGERADAFLRRARG